MNRPVSAPSDAASSPRAPRILLTNDDGWGAAGLIAIAEVLAGFAELHVAAPRHEQSGVGHGITLRAHLDVEAASMRGAAAAYIVHGTPADCAKVGIKSLMADAPPDLVVSGLNDGPNVGVNVLYSGTVGAALEAAINGVSAVAVSKEFGDGLGFAEAASLLEPLLRKIAARGLPRWHILNVNVPSRPRAEIRGVRLTRHGVSGFEEFYTEAGAGAPPGSRRFSLDGVMKIRDTGGLSDAEALSDGFISVTPLDLNLTAIAAPDADLDAWRWVAEEA